MDIIIFGGQSNMQGQTECLSENTIVPNAYEYRFLDNDIIPLKNPAGENITYGGTLGCTYYDETDAAVWLGTHALGGACYGHTNMVSAFCRSYIAETKGKVLAVHAAKGSTTVAQWLPGTAGYEMLKRKVLAAKKKAASQDEIGRIGFVWLQGESDAIEGTSKEDYKRKMYLLAETLKQDLGVENFGIIRVGCFTGDNRDWQIIDAQDELCKEDSMFLMLTKIATDLNKIPEYMNPYAHGHFSAKGLEILGEVSGKELGVFFGNTNTTMPFVSA